MAQPLAPTASAQRQSFLSVQSFDPFVIDREALAANHPVQHRTAPPPSLLGQCAQPLPQFAVAVLYRCAPEPASCDPDQPASATLRQAMFCDHVRDHLPLHTAGRSHFLLGRR